MRNDPALDLLCSYLEAEDPSYLVRLDNHHERVSVVWSNGAAQQLASDVPGVVLAACLVTLQGDSAQHRAKRRRRLDSTWQLTVLEGAEDMPLAVITRISPAAPSSTLSESFDLHALLSACEVPNGVRSEDQHDFLKLFVEVDWAATELGAMSTWPSELWSHVILALCSPTPVLFVWGEQPGTMIYNERYAEVAGTKHPAILGKRYDVGWAEVWSQIDPFVARAYAGHTTYYTDIPMFLRRKGFLEECFFFWYMAPIYTIVDGEPIVRGVNIPNSDQTAAVISRRRLRLLNNLHLSTATARTLDAYWRIVYDTLCAPDIAMDLPHCAIYTVASEVGKAHSAAQLSRDKSVDDDEHFWYPAFEPLFDDMKRRGSDTPAGPLSEFRLVTPRPPAAHLPEAVDALRPLEPKVASRAEQLLRTLINRLRAGEKTVLLDADQCALLWADAERAVWPEDRLRSAVICSLEASQPAQSLQPGVFAEDPLGAVAIFALNTRRPYDAEYADFIRLLAAQLTAGHAGIISLIERVFNAQYLAWSTHQQHEEVKLELEKRTREWRRSEAHFERIFRIIPAGMWIASGPSSKIRWVNESWYRISGHPREASVDTFMDSVHPDDLELSQQTWSHATTPSHWPMGEAVQQPSLSFRWKGVTAEGLERWCTSTAMIERGEDGYPVITGVLQDLSHFKYAEQVQRARADDAVQRKTRLNSFIDLLRRVSEQQRLSSPADNAHSHELRNPLGAISSGIELVSDRLRTSDVPAEVVSDCQEELGVVSYCLTHIRRLVDETLHMSKTEHDFVSLHMDEFDVVELAQKTLRLFQSDAKAKAISLSLNVGRGIMACRAERLISDPGRIAQIAINYLTNALKFVADRPKREISVTVDASETRPDLPGRFHTEASEPGAIASEVLRTTAALAEVSTISTPKIEASERVYLRVDVTDTGVGLDEEQQQRLFVKWAQAMTPKTERTYGGSGLGLHFSRKLAILLQGQCGLASELGVGSTFSFYVTCRRAPTAIESMPTPVASPLISPSRSTNGPTYRVLLVEDNLINQRLLARQLSRAGCTVTTADDGQYAIDTLLTAAKDGTGFDVCAMDVEMPRLNGLEATRRIRQLEAEGILPGRIPLVGVSANAREEQRELMLASGMTMTIPKPFLIHQLLQTFGQAIASASTTPD